VPAELIADVQVWRAATQVDPSDLRPTGPPQHGRAARIFQQQLDKRLAAPNTNADEQWRRLLATEAPSATADPFLPELEEKLSNLTRAGFDATHLVRSAAAAGSLPDDHPAAALWWASSITYRKRRTRITQLLGRSRRPGAQRRGHSTSSHPCRAWRRLRPSARAADPASRHRTTAGFIASFTQRATERGTSCSIVSSALSRTLVVRRSRAARLGGARFDAQHVDVDQARLVSVEL
jgi:hypothetical protein